MKNNKSSEKRTLLMSVLMSAPGPVIVGIGLVIGKSNTQLADFIRRSAELVGIIAAFISYMAATKDGICICDTSKKARIERISNIIVGSMILLIIR